MPEPGQNLGPYLLLKRLGAGAMGEVWKARDERLGRLVALKTLPTANVASDEQRSLMLREARAASAVPHPNVVTLYDIYSEDGDDFLVMELVDGPTLQEKLADEGPQSPEDTLDLLIDIAGALRAAHDRGIVHRDVKAANIMLTGEGVVKVLDFGLAKLRESDLDAAGIGQGGRKPMVDPHMSIDETALPTMDLSETNADQKTIEVSPGKSRPVNVDGSSGVSETMAAQATPVATEDIPSGASATMAAQSSGVSETMAAQSAEGGGGGSGGESGSGGGASSGTSGRSATSTEPLGTVTGDFIGTPLYMSPEQVLGEKPDAISEVFSVGVLGYELLAGKSPYKSRKLEDLFVEIQRHQFPPLPETTPDELKAIIETATGFERADRYPSMGEFHDAMVEVRDRLFGARAQSRWVWLVAAGIAATAAGVSVYVATREPAAEPVLPGDEYVERALEEYEVFYNQKAASSLKAALKVAPDHPRAHAYMLLFGAAKEGERRDVVRDGQRILANLPEGAKRDRALLGCALALSTDGADAAREALAAAGADSDLELAFWTAELAYRARDYEAARVGFRDLLASDAGAFAGRIYDHYSAVLLYVDDAGAAVKVGKAYAEAFPGEADALGVYATTLAAAGELDEALKYAEEAVSLNSSEDTYAGLAKVRAYRGELAQARKLYEKSMVMAEPPRRVLRRAALGLLHLADAQTDEAGKVLEPCLPGGEDAQVRERGPCLWAAGLLWPDKIPALVAELETLDAAGTALHPPYGFPANLAALLKARETFAAGGCILDADPPAAPADAAAVERWLEQGRDFYASYHVPFFTTFAVCERAALALARGDAAAARKLLEPMALDSRPHILLLLGRIAEQLPDLERDEILERAAAAWPNLDPDSSLAKRLAR